MRKVSGDVGPLRVPDGMPRPIVKGDDRLANLHPKLTDQNRNTFTGNTVVGGVSAPCAHRVKYLNKFSRRWSTGRGVVDGTWWALRRYHSP